MIVRASPKENYAWIAERTGCALTPDFRAIEAVRHDNSIAGMVGFSSWTPNSVQMHVAVASPIVVRSLLVPAFSYVFEESGRGVAVGLVNSDNAEALRLDSLLGFKEKYRIRDGHAPGIDIVLMEMRKEECPWLLRKAA